MSKVSVYGSDETLPKYITPKKHVKWKQMLYKTMASEKPEICPVCPIFLLCKYTVFISTIKSETMDQNPYNQIYKSHIWIHAQQFWYALKLSIIDIIIF